MSNFSFACPAPEGDIPPNVLAEAQRETRGRNVPHDVLVQALRDDHVTSVRELSDTISALAEKYPQSPKNPAIDGNFSDSAQSKFYRN